MASIFDRIRQKTQQAFSGIGNFIDRDKSLPGVQLAQGGLSNRIGQAVQQAVPRIDQGIDTGARFLADNLSKVNIPLTPSFQRKYQTGGSYKPSIPVGDIIAKTFIHDPTTNRTLPSSPLWRLGDIQKIQDPKEREKAQLDLNLSTLMMMGTTPTVKGGSKAIFDAETSKNLEDILGTNPQLMPKQVVKSIDQILNQPSFREAENVLSGNTVLPVPKNPRNTLYTTPEGVTFKPNKQPNTTRSVDRMLANADEVISKPQTAPVSEKPLFLESPQKPLALEQPSRDLTLTELKKSVEKGYNLENLTVQVRNAAEARQALSLGVNANQIAFPTKAVDEGAALFSGDLGVGQDLDQVGEALRTVNTEEGVKKFGKLNTVLEPRRLLRKILPDDAYNLAERGILEPLNAQRGEAAVFKKQYLDRVQALGPDFKVGSKVSELTQKYGEGLISERGLVSQLGPDDAERVINATDQFRGMYDEILDTVNGRRVDVGLDPIVKRADYFRHMQELSSGIGDNLSDLFSGGSGQKSASIMKQRLTGKTTYDAVGGMINYLDKAGRAGFTDTVVPHIKDLAGNLQQSGDSQAAGYLNWYADSILGIKQDPGAIENFLANTSAKMRGSKVVGNLSSVINQTASYPLGINDAGWGNYIKGLTSQDAKQAAQTSSYLLDASSSVPSNFYSGGRQVVAKAGDVLQAADLAGKRTVWQAMFEKAKSLGSANPSLEADKLTEAAMGSRGIGSASQFQDSWFGKIVAPFTNEAQTQANRIVELVGAHKAGTLIGLAVTNFLFNEANQRFGTGNRVLIDPIKATTDAYEQLVGSDRKEASKLKAATRILAESLQLSPVAQSIAVGSYQFAKLFDPEGKIIPDSRNIFGSEDPTRMGSVSLYNPLPTGKRITGAPLVDAPLETASRFIPFGNQAVKTLQSGVSQAKGAVESKGGKILFPTPKDVYGKVRSLAFGQYATPEAQNYFENDFSRPLTDKQSKLFYNQPADKRGDLFNNLQQSTRTTQQIKSGGTPGKKTFLDTILGREAAQYPDNFTPTTTAEKTAFKTEVTTSLDAGLVPPSSKLKSALFDGKSATSKSIDERMSVYKALNSVVDNEYTPEQRKAILEASGADPESAQYYALAAKDEDVRLQELVPTIDSLPEGDLVTYLMQGRRKVGGKQLISDAMTTYLYDNNYISAGEEKAIKALKYDEVNDKFYWKRTGGGGISYSQAKTLFKLVKLPSFKELKSVTSLLQHSSSTSQRDASGEKLLSSILSGRRA